MTVPKYSGPSRDRSHCALAQGPCWLCLLWQAEWGKTFKERVKWDSIILSLSASYARQSLLCGGSCSEGSVQGALSTPRMVIQPRKGNTQNQMVFERGEPCTVVAQPRLKLIETWATKKQGHGHTACWWLCSVHGWLSWGLGVQADTSALTVQLGRGLRGSDVSPPFTLHCKACCSQAAVHTKNCNHSALRREVHCNHQKPPCWPHWLSIL